MAVSLVVRVVGVICKYVNAGRSRARMTVRSEGASVHAVRAITWIRFRRSVVYGALFSLYEEFPRYNQYDLDPVDVSFNSDAVCLTGMIEVPEWISMPTSFKDMIFVVDQVV